MKCTAPDVPGVSSGDAPTNDLHPFYQRSTSLALEAPHQKYAIAPTVASRMPNPGLAATIESNVERTD